DLLAFALFLRPHLAGRVHLWPGDMTVHIDAARHYHQARRIQRPRRPHSRIAWRLDDLVAADPQVFHLAVDTVGRVIDVAARDEEIVNRHRSGHSGDEAERLSTYDGWTPDESKG